MILSNTYNQSNLNYLACLIISNQTELIFSVNAKAEITDLQMQMESLKEKNTVLEKTNQNVKYISAFYFD